MENIDYALPPNTKALPNQAAGHRNGGIPCILKHEDGSVLKRLPNDYRAEKEQWFYQIISRSCDECLIQLASFIPSYRGIWTVEQNNSKVRYLRLEDISERFKKPSNLDVKIGPITYDPDASKEKQKYEEEKYPEVKVIGFRILGMHVYNKMTDKCVVYDKQYGKTLTAETVVAGLHAFLNSENNWISPLIICGFLHRLKIIEAWFSVQRRFAFYTSSLLFFYEGDTFVWLNTVKHIFPVIDIFTVIDFLDGEQFFKHNHSVTSSSANFDYVNKLQNEVNSYFFKNCVLLDDKVLCSVCYLNVEICQNMQSTSLIDIRMIDFAHVYEVQAEDKNYIFGLYRLIETFETLQKQILQEYQRISNA